MRTIADVQRLLERHRAKAKVTMAKGMWTVEVSKAGRLAAYGKHSGLLAVAFEDALRSFEKLHGCPLCGATETCPC